MNRFVAFLVLLVVVGVGVGFYLDWFKLSKAETTQKTDFTISVDKDKIKEDAEKAKEKVQDVGNKVKDKAETVTDKGKE